MCVLAVCKKRALTETEAEQCWRDNSDGAGVAWIVDGKVRYVKGFMKLKKFKEFYFGKKFPFPHVVHFRRTSVGATTPELTHPFICSDDSPLRLEYSGKEEVLFHNGHWASYLGVIVALSSIAGKKLEGRVSDSRVIAIVRFNAPDTMDDIVADSRSRIAALSPKGVETFGDFKEEDGVLFSNLQWKPCKTKIIYSTAAAYRPTITPAGVENNYDRWSFRGHKVFQKKWPGE